MFSSLKLIPVMIGIILGLTIIITNQVTSTSERPQIGFEYIDGGSVLWMWNTLQDGSNESYYINTSSGIQLTNVYGEYWTKNVFCVGYFASGEWNLIKCVDELDGFIGDVVTDNETFVNYTLYKDMNYQDYDFRLALRYNLEANETHIQIISYVKNLGQPINFDIGFAWRVKDINISGLGNEFIYFHNLSNATILSYNLSEELDVVLTMNDIYTGYLIDDVEGGGAVDIDWNDVPEWAVWLQSTPGQYNAIVNFALNVGTLSSGQEKYTNFSWHDAECATSCTRGCSISNPNIYCPDTRGDYTTCGSRVGWDTNVSGFVQVNCGVAGGGCSIGTGCLLSWTTLEGATYNTVPVTGEPIDCSGQTCFVDAPLTDPFRPVYYHRFIQCEKPTVKLFYLVLKNYPGGDKYSLEKTFTCWFDGGIILGDNSGVVIGDNGGVVIG